MAKEVLTALPYNLEAEQSLLGSILIDQELQYEIRSKLKTEDFYVESHKLIFEAISSIIDSNKAVDVVVLTDEMSKTPAKKLNKRLDIATLAEELERKTTLEKAGGIEYLSELSRVTPSAANFEYYLNIVKRDSTLRKLIRCAEIITKDAKVSTDMFSSVANAEKLIYDISEQLDSSTLTNINDDMSGTIERIHKIQTEKDFMQGLQTGFTAFDNMTNGLHKGNLIIIAARPSVGKTALAMNIVQNVAIKKDAVCAVFSLEMTKDELRSRMLCSLSGVSSQRINKFNQLSGDDWAKIYKAQKLIDKTQIYIDDTSMTTVPEILSKCRRLKAQKGKLDLILVDHMQLMNATRQNDSRQAEITEISRGLKMIAKELDVPVVVLSQLNRALDKANRKPILSDLRESGSIEQDADIVMFIHRPSMTNDGLERGLKQDETQIIISKNRSGPVGAFNLVFKGENYKFVNIVYDSYAPAYNDGGYVKAEVPEQTNYGGFSKLTDNDIPPENEELFAPEGVDDVF